MKIAKPVTSIHKKMDVFTSGLAQPNIESTHKHFRISDGFYKQLVESLNDYCVFTTDKQGIISSWNSGAEILLGYTKKEIIGKNASIIFTDEDQKCKVLQQEMNAAKNKRKALDERWHVKKNKKLFWGSGLVFPLDDDNDKLQGFTIIMHDLTEARNQAIQLQESEAFNKSIFNSSPDCITVLELSGNLIAMNEAGIKMMEINDIKKHLGEPWFDGWDDQYNRHAKKAMILAKRGTVGRFQGTRPTMKGGYKWWDVSISPVFDSAGKIKQLLCVSHDTTDQKYKEAERRNLMHELEMERTKLADLFENAPSFLSITRGKNYTYEMVNKAYYDLVGTRDLIGRTLLECFPEIEEQGIIALHDKVYTTGKPLIEKELKVMLYQSDKKKFVEKYLNFVYQPTRDKLGRIDGIASHGFDITEQVQARKEAEEMRERFEVMANNIPNLAWMADADGWILWYNNRWYEYTGTTPKEMEGWGWQSVHDPEKLPEVIKQWQYSLRTGEPFEMVYPLKGADGIFKPFLTRIIPIRNNKGEIIRWFGTNTDITKQKELERMKDDFVGIASHELKTPVTVIKAYTQVLEQIFKNNGDQRATNWLGKMNGQVTKLTNLIENLLNVTKIQTGKMVYENALFSLNDLIIEITKHIQETTPDHRIEADLQNSIEVYCDRDRLGQVITNFITNAIKYSPGTDRIIVRTKVTKSDVTVSVQDFGLGISKDNHSRIFEQFYRVNESTQYTFPGIGLGLYISAEIIKKLKGKIWVESEEGKGAQFNFTIPRITKKAVANADSLLMSLEA